MATVTKRGGGYTIRVSCGYDINGKQIVRSTTWKPDAGMSARQIKKELERQKVLFEEACLSGQVADGAIRLAEYAERWFRDYASVQLKANTRALYTQLWRRVEPALGHIRMDRINANHLNSFYRNLLEDGMRSDMLYQCVDFKQRLKTAGATAVELAQSTGLGIRTLYSLSGGGNVKPETAQKIANALGCQMVEIFTPVQDSKALSSNTVNHYHKFLSSMFRSAVKQGVLDSNPCERADPPRAGDQEPAYLDEAQVLKMLEALDGAPEQYRVMVLLLLDSGMRRGELLGLEWKDINWDKQTISIRRNSVYVTGVGMRTETPKTQKSIRTIKLPQDTFTMLRQYRAVQLEERLKLGDQWQEHDRLFTQWNGKPMQPASVTGWFAAFAKRIGLPTGTTIHSLRHTNASLLIAAGTNIRTVSARLGHAQTSTTTDIYAHAIQSADAAAAEAIGSIVHRKTKKQA